MTLAPWVLEQQQQRPTRCDTCHTLCWCAGSSVSTRSFVRGWLIIMKRWMKLLIPRPRHLRISVTSPTASFALRAMADTDGIPERLDHHGPRGSCGDAGSTMVCLAMVVGGVHSTPVAAVLHIRSLAGGFLGNPMAPYRALPRIPHVGV